MARRLDLEQFKPQSTLVLYQVKIVPILLIALFVIVGFHNGYIQSLLEKIGIFIVILIILIVLWMGFLFFKEKREKEQKQNLMNERLKDAELKITEIVNEHLGTLVRRRNTLVQFDHYGIPDSKAWNDEFQRFIDKVIRPNLTAEEAQAVADAGLSSVFQRLIEDRIGAHHEPSHAPAVLPPSTTPTEFEELCASILRQEGWTANLTKASGDQGADVIAEKGGKKIVVQCKLYGGSVGNKSVQEVLSAKYYYGSDLAVVVTNSEFTKSARELSRVAKVDLISYVDFSEYLQQRH
jgi:restriction system protein